MAVALLIPYSFYFGPWVGIPMLLGMFKGSLFGSSTTAILIRTLGTPVASATVLDGPLAQQGKGAKAIKMALYVSVFGDTFSDVCLIFLASLLAVVALSFGLAEYTLLIAMALTSLGLLGHAGLEGPDRDAAGRGHRHVGLDLPTAERLTLATSELEEGIGLIPMPGSASRSPRSFARWGLGRAVVGQGDPLLERPGRQPRRVGFASARR
ncbi:MAG: tripartite tricarboxylate transporter permease [Burkholderiaceae bacterium]